MFLQYCKKCGKILNENVPMYSAYMGENGSITLGSKLSMNTIEICQRCMESVNKNSDDCMLLQE